MDRPGSSIRRLIVLLVAVTLLAGCSASSQPAPSSAPARGSAHPRLAWSAVPLPESSAPVTLTADGERLLVGASVTGGRVRPRVFSLDAAGAATRVPLTPRSPYAFLARWQSISVSRGTVWAVGGAAGGAHANTRWTVWKGTGRGLAEVPQPFSTFGGYGAGNLIGSVVTTAGPALVGSWEGARTGLDAAVWLPHGERWLRQTSAGTPLESTRDLLVGPRSATAAGARIVLPGSAVRLSPGSVSQSAAVWRSARLDSGWHRIDLPEAGQSSEAVSAGCHLEECLVAGYVDGRYALWSVSDTSEPRRLTGLPDVPVDPDAPLPAPLRVGDRVVAMASSAGRVVLLSGGPGSWSLTEGPAGVATGSVVVGRWLYVLADPADGPALLWRTAAERLR